MTNEIDRETCGCDFQDRWRCAVEKGLHGNVSCPCVCHQNECTRLSNCAAMMHWSDCLTNPTLKLYTQAQMDAALADARPKRSRKPKAVSLRDSRSIALQYVNDHRFLPDYVKPLIKEIVVHHFQSLGNAIGVVELSVRRAMAEKSKGANDTIPAQQIHRNVRKKT